MILALFFTFPGKLICCWLIDVNFWEWNKNKRCYAKSLCESQRNCAVSKLFWFSSMNERAYRVIWRRAQRRKRKQQKFVKKKSFPSYTRLAQIKTRYARRSFRNEINKPPIYFFLSTPVDSLTFLLSSTLSVADKCKYSLSLRVLVTMRLSGRHTKSTRYQRVTYSKIFQEFSLVAEKLTECVEHKHNIQPNTNSHSYPTTQHNFIDCKNFTTQKKNKTLPIPRTELHTCNGIASTVSDGNTICGSASFPLSERVQWISLTLSTMQLDVQTTMLHCNCLASHRTSSRSWQVPESNVARMRQEGWGELVSGLSAHFFV